MMLPNFVARLSQTTCGATMAILSEWYAEHDFRYVHMVAVPLAADKQTIQGM